jgi:hypothetical protein
MNLAAIELSTANFGSACIALFVMAGRREKFPKSGRVATKRQKYAALQDASRSISSRELRQVLDCDSPLPLGLENSVTADFLRQDKTGVIASPSKSSKLTPVFHAQFQVPRVLGVILFVLAGCAAAE